VKVVLSIVINSLECVALQHLKERSGSKVTLMRLSLSGKYSIASADNLDHHATLGSCGGGL
jgi:hypothetical protein